MGEPRAELTSTQNSITYTLKDCTSAYKSFYIELKGVDINYVDNQELSWQDSGYTWEYTNTFSGLTAGKKYHITFVPYTVNTSGSVVELTRFEYDKSTQSNGGEGGEDSTGKYGVHITYNDNGAGVGDIGSSKNESTTSRVAIKLSSYVTSRSGYTALGWSEDPNARSAVYAFGETVTFNGVYGSYNYITLYAVWKKDDEGGEGGGSVSGTLYVYSSTDGTKVSFEVNGVDTSIVSSAEVMLCLPNDDVSYNDYQDFSSYRRNLSSTLKGTFSNLTPGKAYEVHVWFFGSTGSILWKDTKAITTNNPGGGGGGGGGETGETKYGVKIIYDANGGSGGPTEPEYLKYSSVKVPVTITTTEPYRTGYTFLGWATYPYNYTVNPSFLTGYEYTDYFEGYDLSQYPYAYHEYTLYAVWSENASKYGVYISFIANGGTGTQDPIDKESTTSNITIEIPETTFTRSGWQFAGWSATKTAEPEDVEYIPGKSYAFSGKANGKQNYYLYAIWKEDDGNCYIYDGSKWVKATPYIYNGSKWVKASARIYNGGWKS